MIGNGVVVDLGVLFDEIDALTARGVDCSRLLVSSSAHVIASYNTTLDKVTERFLGKRRIGTTGRGIGPTYADKMNRVGIRVEDLFDDADPAAEGRGRARPQEPDPREDLQPARHHRRRGGRASCSNTPTGCARWSPTPALVLTGALDAGRTVLFEGGQATMLDVDHGTYPFVTSSNATAGGACTGSGVPPTRIDRVVAVAKAYTTRVGEGPFPTELLDADGERLREIGSEYGTTTGRPRRCGWYDALVVRHASRVNGVTDLVLTKLDVLTGFERLPVCVGYDVDGVRHDELPMTQTDFHHARPVYEYLEGWSDDIAGVRRFEDLPKTAQAYVLAVEELSGARVSARRRRPGPRRHDRAARPARLTS